MPPVMPDAQGSLDVRPGGDRGACAGTIYPWEYVISTGVRYLYGSSLSPQEFVISTRSRWRIPECALGASYPRGQSGDWLHDGATAHSQGGKGRR